MAKACSMCREIKPTTMEFFYPARKSKDGCQARCKLCSLEVDRKRRGHGSRADHLARLAAKRSAKDRKCTWCGQIKPNTAKYFAPKRRTDPSNVQANCRDCSNAYARQESVKSRAREAVKKTPRRLKRRAEAMARWRARNPEKFKAYHKVAYAIKMGRLVRGPCATCGSTGKTQAHHHKGYSEEFCLDVEWLCRSCHDKHHRAEVSPLAATKSLRSA